MSSKEQEYKEIFLSEALENYEQLNNLFTVLEKNASDKNAIDSIFRITHTLKGNAMGMGFEQIAELSHIMEDVFSAVKENVVELNPELFTNLFKANDKLGELIDALKTDKTVRYKGIKTKLEVFLRNAKDAKANEELKEETESTSDSTPEQLQVSVEEESTAEVSTENDELAAVDEKEKKEIEPLDSKTQEPEAIEELEEIEEDDFDEEEDSSAPKIAFSDLVQVPIRKLDALMNQVGQLIIERDRLIAVNSLHNNGRSSSEFTSLQRITSELQYSVMDVRLVQIGFLFNKFHRIVRDVAVIEKKAVKLELKGTEIEIDRNILQIMSDSLVHLVRNAVSHGIEDKKTRLKRGKYKEGVVTLNARNEKDNVIIEVQDDGHGIDVNLLRKKIVDKGMLTEDLAKQLSEHEILMYIFEPGFSNAEKITEVSGRGVGMDVVRRATESVGGQVSVETEVGVGTTIRLLLPSSMAVKGALLFELEDQEYAFALSFTEAVVSLHKRDIHKMNNGLMARYLDKTISVVFLKDLFSIRNFDEIMTEGVFHQTFNKLESDEKLDVIVVSYGEILIGIVVDKLLQQKEIVEKTMAKPLENVKLLSGTTILGNGNVCLVVDVTSIGEVLFKMGQKKKRSEVA